MQLCAENNMQVVVPSSPSQMFHLVRRQMLQDFRKPLIVMTPKSLLRHKLAVCSLEDLSSGHFMNLIPDTDDIDATRVDRVVFCSGKVYYDLLEERRQRELDNVAIVRIEQLYPFPVEDYAATIRHYPKATEVVWCQEEPQNTTRPNQAAMVPPKDCQCEAFVHSERGVVNASCIAAGTPSDDGRVWETSICFVKAGSCEPGRPAYYSHSLEPLPLDWVACEEARMAGQGGDGPPEGAPPEVSQTASGSETKRPVPTEITMGTTMSPAPWRERRKTK